jgi:hypothetical protein
MNDMESQTNKNITNLPNKKIIRLYYSNINKQQVVGFNLSSSKSFKLNREIWNYLKRTIFLIESIVF